MEIKNVIPSTGKYTNTLLKLLLVCIFLNYITSTTTQIINLTDTNFEEYKSKHPVMLLYFHASYSEESEKLQMHFRALPEHLKSFENNILYAIVSQREYIINHKYNVEFPYPKIILVNKELFYEYTGEMKANLITDWVERKMHKKLQSINTPQDLEDAVMSYDRIVCLVGEDSHLEKFSNSSLTDTFTDLHFYSLKNLTLIQSLNIPEKNKNLEEKIILFKSYDDKVNLFSVDFSNTQKVENFIRTYIYPMVNHLSQTNYLYAINNKLSFGVVLLPNEISEENLKNIITELNQSASKMRGELFFMYGNFSDQYQTTLAIDFEVEEKDLPVVLIQDYNKDTKTIRRFKLENIDLNAEGKSKSISEFFDKFKYNVLKRFLRSQKINRDNPYEEIENVYHLVRKNFEQILMKENENKYALVYFVRRNCGPCNEFYKEFLKVSESNRKEADVIFATVDGLSNEFDEFEVPGYPSVLLFKPG
jgi:hypothetical protein